MKVREVYVEGSSGSERGAVTRVLRRAGLLSGAVLVLAAAFSLVASTAQAAEFKYVGVKKCRSCHKKENIGNQFGAWQESAHAKAFETLASDDAKKIAAEKGIADAQKAPECLKCHVTAYDTPAEQLAKKWDPTLGVQCEACHGPGSGYRKKKVMMDHDKAVAKGLMIPDAKTCEGCHNDESPTFESFDFEKAVEEIAHPVPEDYDPGADKDEEEEG
jgi:hypothetical protein